MKIKIRIGIFGLILGFVLSQTGFSDYGEVHRMFIIADLRLYILYFGAVILTMFGLLIAGRGKTLPVYSIHKATIPGGIIFGIGWGLTCACPAIPLVRIGEGYIISLITLSGIVIGMIIANKIQIRFPSWRGGKICEG